MTCSVLYPCEPEEKGQKGRKEWFNFGSQPRGIAPTLWTLSLQMSHRGLSRIYSSAAEFMIIVTSPWQFAFCPSRRSSCSPSAILRSMPYFRQSQGQNLQRRRFPKTKTTCRPGKKLKKKKKKGGGVPQRRKRLCRAESWRKTTFRANEGCVWRTFRQREWGLAPPWCLGRLLISSSRTCLVLGTQGSCRLLFPNFCTTAVWIHFMLLSLTLENG